MGRGGIGGLGLRCLSLFGVLCCRNLCEVARDSVCEVVSVFRVPALWSILVQECGDHADLAWLVGVDIVVIFVGTSDAVGNCLE